MESNNLAELKNMIDRINLKEENVVHFTPPQMFMQLNLVHEMEIGNGNISSVSTSGPVFYYRVDDEVEKFFASRKPDFFTSD